MILGNPNGDDRAERVASRAARLSHFGSKAQDGRRAALHNNDIYQDIEADIVDYYEGSESVTPIPDEVKNNRLESEEELIEAVSENSGESRRSVEDTLEYLKDDAEARRE
ncbi:MAG TPA: hypothetical protein VNZ52_12355 [Candidatus Thermoplasmatota archaeon]|nr:hypothetical protein [Candidatus Thermoplasmatota archaeon]